LAYPLPNDSAFLLALQDPFKEIRLFYVSTTTLELVPVLESLGVFVPTLLKAICFPEKLLICLCTQDAQLMLLTVSLYWSSSKWIFKNLGFLALSTSCQTTALSLVFASSQSTYMMLGSSNGSLSVLKYDVTQPDTLTEWFSFQGTLPKGLFSFYSILFIF
jgi:hypothetical protein